MIGTRSNYVVIDKEAPLSCSNLTFQVHLVYYSNKTHLSSGAFSYVKRGDIILLLWERCAGAAKRAREALHYAQVNINTCIQIMLNEGLLSRRGLTCSQLNSPQLLLWAP